jgi:hypothetical protein
MSDRVFVPRRERRAAPPKAKPGGFTTVGTSGPVTVQFQTSLGGSGRQLAQGVLATAPADYQRVAALFGLASSPPVLISIEALSAGSDGTGGAWHQTCSDTTLHCDASLDNQLRTSALWVAEFVEVLEDAQGGGWSCGDTNGEGLSRVIAEWAYPGALADYATAALWLDGSRPNWIDNQVGSDVDDESNGCSTLFLWWLVSLGFPLDQVAAAAADTLAGTYEQLTGKTDAWAAFSAACEANWPAGQPSGVTSDNPWPTVSPPPPPPPPPPPSSAPRLNLSADVVAGEYALVEVKGLRERIGRANLAPGELVAIMQALLQLLLTLLGGQAPIKPPASSSSAVATPPRETKPPKGKK